MGCPACKSCDECGSGLAPPGIIPRAPEAHDTIERYDPVTGARYDVCRACWTRSAPTPPDDVSRLDLYLAAACVAAVTVGLIMALLGVWP